MSEVSCRILDVILKDARRREIPAELLVRDVGVTLEHLRDRRARISWQDFVGVLENVGRYCSPDDLTRLGGDFARSPLLRPFALVARLLFSARDFYQWGYSSKSPAHGIFGACMSSEWLERSATEGVVTLTLHEGLRTSPEFDLITRGVITELPRLVGAPPATVTMERLPRGVRYLVRFTPGKARLAWLRKLLLWPFTAWRAGYALKEAHEGLSERFLELVAAKQIVAAQATQLQTAHSISQLVHSALDLGKTMEAVAVAFTSIGGFAGAHVRLADTHEHLAWSGVLRGAPDLVLSLDARGQPLGTVELWHASGADARELSALADMVTPTVAMAIDGARAYAGLLDAQQHLERRVEQRTHELSEARDALRVTVSDLQAAERARAKLFANVNHEIRTPLTLILLSLDELRRAADADPERDRALVSIGRNARKLLRLVDGLLDLAAASESKLSISPAQLDLGAMVGELLESFGASARACGVRLRAEIEPGSSAEVDESAVERIVSNLLSNAIKFTPPGGEVFVKVQRVGDSIELTMSDTGIGVSEAFLSRIFGRFEQDGRPLRPGTPGSGIGLSLVRDLAEAHLGRVSVERLERGTRFRVVLPLIAQPGIHRAPPDTVRPRRSTATDFGLPTGEVQLVIPVLPRREHTLLVVEDDAELRARLVEILSPRYNLIEAADAARAIELAEAQRPDLLVSDIGLPGVDGLELTRQFAALPGNRLAPVLLLSAFASLENRLSGFEAGAIDYLTKPFDPNELIARVQAQLERRKIALQLHDSEKLASIGTMTAGLAHEMRNPANALVNAIEPLIEMLPPDVRAPGSGVAELLEIIRDCSAQIGLLSRQLLGFRRGVQIAREPVDATLLVERALGILRPALRDVELRSELRFVGKVPCAPALVLQVLGNLLDNAAHAARKGAAPTQIGWVSITTREERGHFVCEVADSGPGVAAALRERIFEPFFTTKAPGEGSGLGLSTSRQIAQRHEGALFVRPSPGGSIFRFELPLTPSEGEGAILAG